MQGEERNVGRKRGFNERKRRQNEKGYDRLLPEVWHKDVSNFGSEIELLNSVPPPVHWTGGGCSWYKVFMEHPKKEQTLVLIKPDGVQRSLIGEIISRYERTGLKLVGLKFLVPTKDLIEKHYTLDPMWRQKNGEKTIASYKAKGLPPPSEDPFEVSGITLEKLKNYLTSGSVVAMVWQGANAVAMVKKITGATEPLNSDVGTIRGDFMLDSFQTADQDQRAVRNLTHISGSVEEAQKEIKLWFESRELISYNLVQEKILYDVNLDGILE